MAMHHRLRAARERAGLSLRAVARLLLEEHGIRGLGEGEERLTHAAVQHWETGENRPPVDTFWALCLLYGANPIYILSGQGRPELASVMGADEAFERGVRYATGIVRRAIEGLEAGDAPGPFDAPRPAGPRDPEANGSTRTP